MIFCFFFFCLPAVQAHAENSSDGEFAWDSTMQGYLLGSFFYGYVITQIPFGILAKRYGSKYFLGVGMLINSLFGLLVPVSAHLGYYYLMGVRFIQGLGEVSDHGATSRSRVLTHARVRARDRSIEKPLMLLILVERFF